VQWTRLGLAVLIAGVITSLTDWFFAGDWIHRRWTYREVWRAGSETRAIALTSPLPFLTSAVFSYLAVRLRLHALIPLIELAVAVWLIAPLPLILTFSAFMKLHRVFVTSIAIGWLVKLAIIASIVAWLS